MKKNTLLIKLLIIIFLSFIISIFIVRYYSIKITPRLLKYAEIKTKEITLKIMNKSLSEEISEYFPNDILNITRNNNNDIEMINYNTQKLTKFLGGISTNIENNLDILETGDIKELNLSTEELNSFYGKGLIYNIPLGQATNNIFISELGPKIPLKLKINNNMTTGVKTIIKDYGINNALVELDLTIDANIQIILPFASKITKITFTTPLTIDMINGKIPNYYLGGELEYKNKSN